MTGEYITARLYGQKHVIHARLARTLCGIDELGVALIDAYGGLLLHVVTCETCKRRGAWALQRGTEIDGPETGGRP
jgi:hypothetical protein